MPITKPSVLARSIDFIYAMTRLNPKATESIIFSVVCLLLFLGAALALPSSDSDSPEYGIAPPDQSWVDKTLSAMTLREKIGQLIQVRVYGKFLAKYSQSA